MVLVGPRRGHPMSCSVTAGEGLTSLGSRLPRWSQQPGGKDYGLLVVTAAGWPLAQGAPALG